MTEVLDNMFKRKSFSLYIKPWMLSILLVDTVGGELHQLLFASFADESTPAPKNYNNNQWKRNLLAMSRFEAYMYKRFWSRSITNSSTAPPLSAYHLPIVINEVKFARLTTSWPFGVLKPWTEFHYAGHGPQNTSDLESNSLPAP